MTSSRPPSPPLSLLLLLPSGASPFLPPAARPPPPPSRIRPSPPRGRDASSQPGAERAPPPAFAFVGADIGPDLRGRQARALDPSAGAPDDGEWTLASLFGSAEDRDAFFSESFGRRAVHLPGTGRRIDPPMAGLDLPSLYETNDWTTLRVWGSRKDLDKDETSLEDLRAYVGGGGSMVIPITPDDYLFPAKVRIERALGLEEGTGTSMNVYRSGPSAVALDVHYDSYPVFVLQLEGEKEWMIQDGGFGLPAAEVAEWRNLTMAEGDLLYIPMGVLHAATTAEGCDVTTHATIGLL